MEKAVDEEHDEDIFFNTAETTDSTPANSNQVPAASQSEPPEPVRFLDINFNNASVDKILDGFQIKKVRYREVGFAGIDGLVTVRGTPPPPNPLPL